MESVETACTMPPLRPQPRIAAFVGENSCDSFVVCEQQVMCKVPNLKTALFIAFASYSCFNLEYPTLAKNVFFFFQDYILGHPDSRKKSVEVILELYQTLNATFKCFVRLSCDSFFHHYSLWTLFCWFVRWLWCELQWFLFTAAVKLVVGREVTCILLF